MSSPVTNVSALTAFDLGTLTTNTLVFNQDVDYGGVIAPQVWVKFRTSPRAVVVGVNIYGTGTSYRPRLYVYEGPASAPTRLSPGGFQYSPVFESAGQFPVAANTTYYIKFTQDFGTPVPPGRINLQILEAPNLPVPVGSYVVPDDQTGYPAAVISAVDGTLLRFIPLYAAGEKGEAIANGSVLVQSFDLPPDGENRGWWLYDASYIMVTRKPVFVLDSLGRDLYSVVRANPTKTAWWVAQGANAATVPQSYNRVARVAADGSYGTVYDMGVATLTLGLSSLAVNPAETRLYFSTFGAIHLYDLVNSVLLSDIIAAPAAGEATTSRDGILVLPDGRIVVTYRHVTPAPSGARVRVYSSAGALLATYVYDGRNIEAMTSALDPNNFVLWFQDDGITDKWEEVRASDGVTVNFATNVEFEVGLYSGGGPLVDFPGFGHSQSCPSFLTTLGQAIPPPPGGDTPPGNLPMPQPCCDTAGSTAPSAGPVLPPVTALPTLVCTGGAVVPQAPDLSLVELWDY